MRKRTPKQVNTVFRILFAAGILTGLMGAFGKLELLTLAGVAVLLGSIVYRLIFFRCPHCEKYLDRSTGDFCPYCGKAVNS